MHSYPFPVAICTAATPCAQPHPYPKACVTPTGVCSLAPLTPPARDPEIAASCDRSCPLGGLPPSSTCLASRLSLECLPGHLCTWLPAGEPVTHPSPVPASALPVLPRSPRLPSCLPISPGWQSSMDSEARLEDELGADLGTGVLSDPGTQHLPSPSGSSILSHPPALG